MRRLAILMAVSLLPGLCAAQATNAVTLRVLTYNIRHGEGMDGRIDLERVAALIRAQKPDLVALQEVDRGTRRAGGADQAAELGRLTGMHHAFGKAMDYSGGEYGEAVLSRAPILERRTIPLSAGPGHEPRAALWVKVETGAEFVGTHLDHLRDPADRIRQIKELNAALSGTNTACILAGDFNTTPGTAEHRMLCESWTDATADDPAPTCPADQPRSKIDYVWFRPAAAFRVLETRVVDEAVASDHRPVLAVLRPE